MEDEYAAASSSSSSRKRQRGSGGRPARITYRNLNFTRPPAIQYGRGYTETKYFDCGISATVTTAGTTWADTEVTCANYIDANGSPAVYTNSALIPTAVGSGYGQVDGNRYRLKKIRVRGTLSTADLTDQADPPGFVACRLLLVMDLQPNGAQAQGEDIIQDYGDAAVNRSSFMRVSTQGGRFRILKDEFILLQAATSATDGANTSSTAYYGGQFSWKYQPQKPLVVNIKSGNATPTVAGLVNCNIFMLAYCTRGNTATAVTVQGASRAYYVD